MGGWLLRWSVPLSGLLSIMLVTWAYLLAPSTYFAIMRAWMIAPAPHPFIDWEWIPSAVRCWNHGVNVYVDNTCYTPVPHGRHNYSPLWLRATFLPQGDRAVAPVGLGLAVSFMAAVALLPPVRTRRELVLMVLAVNSSLVAFALERGNVDVIICILCIAGVWLWSSGQGRRFLGYGIFIFAGLLKFYPVVLVAMALRERPRIFALIAAAALGAMLWMVFAFRSEFALIAGNLPGGSVFTDLIGSVNLPAGLAGFAVWALQTAGVCTADKDRLFTPIFVGLLALLTAGAAILAARLADRGSLAEALGRMSRRESGFLLCGIILMTGCFFVGRSIGYRAVFLVMTLPGLLQLGREAERKAVRIAGRAAAGCLVFVMWVLTLEYVQIQTGLSHPRLDDVTPVGGVMWLLHELAWWGLETVFLSIIFAFALSSPTGEAAIRVLDRLAPSLSRSLRSGRDG